MTERVFTMPDLGEGLEEGEVVTWLVAEGQTVDLNQPLVEVETAKATVEIPSPFAGRVVALHAAGGDLVPVGNPLITFEVAGVGVGDAPQPEDRTVTGYAADIAQPLVDTGAAGAAGAVRATPAVRRLAKDLNVDLTAVAGTGAGGRITLHDVRASAGTGTATVSEDLRSTEVLVNATRRAIADNLTRQAAIPQVTTFRTVDATAWDAFRSELGVSPLPVLVAALARVVAAHPYLNASWGDDRLLHHGKVNVGLAADTERGLMVPVLRDTTRRGIGQLAEEIRRLAAAARAGHLGAADVSGATIAVSNTGSYGSEAGTPILAPGTTVTLAVGVIAPRALVVDGVVTPRLACTLSLTFDHRVLDGAAAGRALTDLVDLLQDPVRLRDLPA